MFTFSTRFQCFRWLDHHRCERFFFLPGHPTHYVKIRLVTFIFADNDGAECIHLVDEVLLRTEATLEKENDEREKIADGNAHGEVCRVFGIL